MEKDKPNLGPDAPPDNGGSTPPSQTPTSTEVQGGHDGASQSFPAISGFAGYSSLYLDKSDYFRNIPANFNSILCIQPGEWPPGYRVPNGQPGGTYGSGQAKGTEPIRIQPPVSGCNRVTFLTLVKLLARNKGNASASFCVGLGVADVSESNRPMRPYLGYAHDLDLRNGVMEPESLAGGEARTITMFRVDTCDNNLNGGIEGWPNWTMNVCDENKLYPAVAISVRNYGPAFEIGNVFAVGVVL